MITSEMLKDAHDTLAKYWPDSYRQIVEVCATVKPFGKASAEFLTQCTACGGNWGGMLLSGIRELYPQVWEVIPDDMGCFAWPCICSVLILCGVDTSK